MGVNVKNQERKRGIVRLRLLYLYIFRETVRLTLPYGLICIEKSKESCRQRKREKRDALQAFMSPITGRVKQWELTLHIVAKQVCMFWAWSNITQTDS